MQRIILSVCFLMFSVSILSAQNWWKNKIRGEGDVKKETIQVEDFDGFSLAISGDVYLRQGDKQEIVIKAQPNIIRNMIFKVKDGHLKITYDRPIWRTKDIDIYMTVPSLERIGVSGSGNVKTDGKFTSLGDLSLVVSGSGNLSLDCDAQDLNTRISGSGNIKIGGNASSISSQVSGSGNIDAGDLKAKTGRVKISGSGNAVVYTTEKLNAQVSGSGNVKYRGEPEVSIKTSGSGKVRSY